MLADQLFRFLLRSDVQEIALHAGRPPCALVEGAYRRLSAQQLRDEDIMAVLMAAKGQEHLSRLRDGCSWELQVNGVGPIRVTALNDGIGLKLTLRLRDRASQPEPDERAAQPGAKRPSRAPRTKAEAAPAKRVSARPVRKSHRPQRKPPQPEPAARPASSPVIPAVAERKRPQSEGVSLPPPPTDAGLLSGSPYSLPAGPIAPDQRPLGGLAAAAVSRHELQGAAAAHSLEHQAGPHQASRQHQAAAPARPEPAGKARRPELQALSEPPPPQPPPKRPLPDYEGDRLDDVLRGALERHASDLHVVAGRPVLLRLAGELVAYGASLSAADVEQLVMVRVPAAKRPELEQSGSCDFALTHPAYGRFRCNVSRQRTGLKLTARLIGAEIPSLEELGLPQAMRKALHHHQGLIVVTGPTGHGKTTTMAALVGIINRETSHHVITVEDPIEFTHVSAKAVISQREVGSHTKTFQAALKASLREDPDVIVVGELRDTETVRMALSASETGHLVISTMNTPSAAKAIERLIDLFPPGDQPQVRMTLAGGLRLITSQRLLPSADRKQLCAAAELLPGCTALWSLIRDNRTYQITSLQQRGKSLGIIRLDDSLAELVRSGRTTLEIAREYADAPQQFDALVAGRPIPAAQTVEQPAAPDEAGVGAAAAKRGIDLGKQVLSRAGKLFGNEPK